MQLRAKHNYEFNKIIFEKNTVSVRLRQFSIKRIKLRPGQLIRHFTSAEIKRAAIKLMKKKKQYNF